MLKKWLLYQFGTAFALVSLFLIVLQFLVIAPASTAVHDPFGQGGTLSVIDTTILAWGIPLGGAAWAILFVPAVVLMILRLGRLLALKYLTGAFFVGFLVLLVAVNPWMIAFSAMAMLGILYLISVPHGVFLTDLVRANRQNAGFALGSSALFLGVWVALIVMRFLFEKGAGFTLSVILAAGLYFLTVLPVFLVRDRRFSRGSEPVLESETLSWRQTLERIQALWAEPRERRLTVASFFLYDATKAIVAALPFHTFLREGLGESVMEGREVLIVFSAACFSAFFLCPLAGIFADKRKPSTIMMTLVFGLGGAVILSVQLGSFLTLVLLSALVGFAVGSIWALIKASVLDYVPAEQLSWGYAYLMISNQFSYVTVVLYMLLATLTQSPWALAITLIPLAAGAVLFIKLEKEAEALKRRG